MRFPSGFCDEVTIVSVVAALPEFFSRLLLIVINLVTSLWNFGSTLQ